MVWVRIGAVLGFLAVVAGAFGSHALKETLDEKHRAAFEVAARYQMYHALALIAVGLLQGRCYRRARVLAGVLLLVGTILFSGTLYFISLFDWKVGMVTPIGGVIQLAGWLCLALSPGPEASKLCGIPDRS